MMRCIVHTIFSDERPLTVVFVCYNHDVFQ